MIFCIKQQTKGELGIYIYRNVTKDPFFPFVKRLSYESHNGRNSLLKWKTILRPFLLFRIFSLPHRLSWLLYSSLFYRKFHYYCIFNLISPTVWYCFLRCIWKRYIFKFFYTCGKLRRKEGVICTYRDLESKFYMIESVPMCNLSNEEDSVHKSFPLQWIPEKRKFTPYRNYD